MAGAVVREPSSKAPPVKAQPKISSSHRACSSPRGPARISWPAAAVSSCAIRRRTWIWSTHWLKAQPARSLHRSRSNRNLWKSRRTTSRNSDSIGCSGNSVLATRVSLAAAAPAATNSIPPRQRRVELPTTHFSTPGRVSRSGSIPSPPATAAARRPSPVTPSTGSSSAARLGPPPASWPWPVFSPIRSFRSCSAR